MFDYIDIIDAPDICGSVLFTTESSKVFREDDDVTPLVVSDKIKVMPWGRDNQMPYDIMELVDADETVSTCMEFNTEVAFGAGLEYRASDSGSKLIKKQVADFFEQSDIDSLFFGQCADMKMFNFCVTAIILNKELNAIEALVRKEAAYCRFSVQDKKGVIPSVVYANWRNTVT